MTYDKNDMILHSRLTQYDKIPGPRVGDWIREHNGRMTRITHDWTGYKDNPSMQSGGEHGRFYLGAGYISYSGGLDAGTKKGDLIRTNEIKPGAVWFFKDDYHTAHNGIDYMVDFRVYKVR